MAGDTPAAPWAGRLFDAGLAAAAAAGLAAAALVINLQFTKTPPGEAVEKALARHPADAWLLKKRGELNLHSGGPGAAARGRGAPDSLYSLRLAALADSLAAGETGAAGKRFREVEELWSAGRNGLRAAPYARDRELESRIRAANLTLWDTDIYETLLAFPPAKRPGMIAVLGRVTKLTPKLRYLSLVSGEADAASAYDLAELLPAAPLPAWLDAREAAARLLPAALAAAPRCARPEAGADALIISAMELELKDSQAGLLARYQPEPEKTGPADALALAGLLRGLRAGPLKSAPALPDREAPLYAWLAYRCGGCKKNGGAIFSPYAAAAAASFYSARGRKAGAARLLSGLDPLKQDYRTALLSALVLQELGDHEGGLRFADRAVQLAGREPAGLNQRGVLLRLKGANDAAAADFSAALALAPGYFPAAVNLGSLMAAEGRASEAAAAYRQALGAKNLPDGVRRDILAYLKKTGNGARP